MKKGICLGLMIAFVVGIPFGVYASDMKCARPPKTQGRVNYFLTSFIDVESTLGSYIPSDLVLVDTGLTKEGRYFCLRKSAYESFVAMNDALKQDTGLHLIVRSGYRSHTTQGLFKELFGEYAALPGRSEHQLGTAIDVIGSGPEEYFIDSLEYVWMKEHAAMYGFVESFKEEDHHHSGMPGEPWHWRYVGPEMAARIVDSGDSVGMYLDMWNKLQALEDRG